MDKLQEKSLAENREVCPGIEPDLFSGMLIVAGEMDGPMSTRVAGRRDEAA
jgi:hypothetical protein